jgi:hypothetical protein
MGEKEFTRPPPQKVMAPHMETSKLPVEAKPEDWSTETLFARTKATLAAYTAIPFEDCDLLMYWVLSTWFTDKLPIAPCLLLTGSAHDGDVVLHALNAFCRNSVLLDGLSRSSMCNYRWGFTILIKDRLVGKKGIALLNSTTPGYRTGIGGGYHGDLYNSKAIYFGQHLPDLEMPLYSLHINLATAETSRLPRPITAGVTKKIQGLLEAYRVKNLEHVGTSEFDASSLPAETRALANALGACIVDAPNLHKNLITLLSPMAEQSLADRSSSITAVVAEACRSLCHQDKTQLYVRDIAVEANRILNLRGEKLTLSPEKVGHRLKSLAFNTGRLDKDGNGLRLDRATREEIHRVASMYLDGGSDQEAGN